MSQYECIMVSSRTRRLFELWFLIRPRQSIRYLLARSTKYCQLPSRQDIQYLRRSIVPIRLLHHTSRRKVQHEHTPCLMERTNTTPSSRSLQSNHGGSGGQPENNNQQPVYRNERPHSVNYLENKESPRHKQVRQRPCLHRN